MVLGTVISTCRGYRKVDGYNLVKFQQNPVFILNTPCHLPRSMAKLAENEVSDLSGCRYLRMRYTEQSQELSFLAKCEKGIRNTLRRGSVLARRLSTAAASGFPMKITIRKVERAADFRYIV